MLAVHETHVNSEQSVSTRWLQAHELLAAKGMPQQQP